MRNVLIIMFVLFINNINAQTSEQIITKYEKGIKGKGYNGAGFHLKVKDDNLVFKLDMNRSKKTTILMPLKERKQQIKMLIGAIQYLKKGEREKLNSNKVISNYNLGKIRMELEFEGRGKGRKYKGLVFVNVYENDKKLLYLAMSKFHVQKFLKFVCDKNFNEYLKAKNKI